MKDLTRDQWAAIYLAYPFAGVARGDAHKTVDKLVEKGLAQWTGYRSPHDETARDYELTNAGLELQREPMALASYQSLMKELLNEGAA